MKKDDKTICVLFPRYISRNFGPPLGPLYICSVLKNEGFGVSFLDGTVMSIEKTIENLKNIRPDFVVLSIQSVFADFAFRLAKEFKKTNPESIIISGGPHASILPEQTLSQEGIDFVVLGEGEETLPDLIHNIKTPQKVKGIAFLKKNKPIFTEPRDSIGNLDKIPFPDRDLLPQEYFRDGSTSIITSRGCPFSCAFCQPTLRKIFGPKYRMRSVGNVINEIKEIKKTFNRKNVELKNIHFTDDGLTYNHKWLEKLAKEIIRQKLDIKWTANTRADTIPDIRLLNLLKSAGLKKFSIGVESGDADIRNKILKKGVSEDKLLKAFDLCHECGIDTHAYLMVGSPEESEKSILSTVKLLDRIRPDNTQVTITSPLPGTYLYDYAKKIDIVEINRWSDFAYCEKSHLELKNFSKEEIKKIQKAIQYTIYLEGKMKKKGIQIRYSTLFYILRHSLVNTSLRALEIMRFKVKKLMR